MSLSQRQIAEWAMSNIAPHMLVQKLEILVIRNHTVRLQIYVASSHLENDVCVVDAGNGLQMRRVDPKCKVSRIVLLAELGAVELDIVVCNVGIQLPQHEVLRVWFKVVRERVG